MDSKSQHSVPGGETYILYDIPSKHGAKCWSPNVWKARAILNVKKVPYSTIWVEYPDIKNVLSQLGISPLNEDPAYTLPMLRVERKSPTGERNSIYLRDSADIVKYINDSYPEPAVDIDGPINAAFGELKNKPGPPFSAIVLTVVPDRLAEVSAVYFRATRKAWLGCSLEERRHKRIEEGAWTEMEEWANEVRGLLRKKGGPLFLGEKLCLLDIRFVGLLKWAEVVGKPEDYARIMQLGGEEFARFWQAAKPIYCTEQD